MNIFKLLFLIGCLPIFTMLAYALLWLTIFINIIEAPLPEEEEVMPDIIIQHTTIDK